MPAGSMALQQERRDDWGGAAAATADVQCRALCVAGAGGG